MLPVDVFGSAGSVRSARAGIRHLEAEGVLIVFPAGEVSRLRAGGIAPQQAAATALAASFSDRPPDASWVQLGTDPVLAVTGEPGAFRPSTPQWLGERSFAGLVLHDGTWELRMLRVVQDDGATLRLGAVLRLRSDLLAWPPADPAARLHGGLGAPGRALVEGAPADSNAVPTDEPI